jgi:hypothetical protein
MRPKLMIIDLLQGLASELKTCQYEVAESNSAAEFSAVAYKIAAQLSEAGASCKQMADSAEQAK